MPKIKSKADKTEFNRMQAESYSFREHNDCAVKAVAFAAGVGYATAHGELKKAGRKNRQGTLCSELERAINALGLMLVEVDPAEIIETYPGNHKGLKSITTHHPERFKKAWEQQAHRTFMMLVSGNSHILTIKDGEVKDWSAGSAKRCSLLYEVVKA